MESQGEPAPHRALDTAGFVAQLRLLKERSGLTYRQLERRAEARGDVLPRSTLADVLGGRTQPRPELLAAFLPACGDGHRVELWLRAWDRGSGRAGGAGAAEGVGEGGAVDGGDRERGAARTGGALVAEPERRPAQPARLAADPRGRSVLVLAACVLALVAAAAGAGWLDTDGPADRRAGEPTEALGADRGVGSVSPGAAPEAPSGWVRIRPATAPGLCVTDGRVRDGRHTPLVAVQRPCDEVPPQGTVLEPLGGDTYRIPWHHPDYGKGCLKVLTDGPGAGLLEPWDACDQGNRFHVEPSGPRGGGRYVLRVDGHGCVGIKGSDTAAGAEAVMGRCVGKGGQVFFIEPAS